MKEGLWIAKLVSGTAIAPLFPWGWHFGEKSRKAALGAKEREEDKPKEETWWAAQSDFFFFDWMWDKEQKSSIRKNWFSSSCWEQASIPAAKSCSPEKEKGSCLGLWPPLKDSVPTGINKQREQRGAWTGLRAPLTQGDKTFRALRGQTYWIKKTSGWRETGICILERFASNSQVRPDRSTNVPSSVCQREAVERGDSAGFPVVQEQAPPAPETAQILAQKATWCCEEWRVCLWRNQGRQTSTWGVDRGLQSPAAAHWQPRQNSGLSGQNS